jgi:hypothetical protein
MPSARKVRTRIAERISSLCDSFSECLARFEATALFTGPSLYFHQKTVARRAFVTDVSEVVRDEQFVDLLYATLTAWGMHRMGPVNATLADLATIKASFGSQVNAIRALQSRTLRAGRSTILVAMPILNGFDSTAP